MVFPLGSVAQVVAVNEEKDYAGIVQVAEVDAPELDESMPVREILHHADAALLPSMTAKEAIAIFEVEAEALAVVQSPERCRVVGLLSESHALRRYAEELELRLRERPPAAPEARSESELGYSPITFASACGTQEGTGVIDRWRSARTSHLQGSAEEPVERRRGRCCRLLRRATDRDGNPVMLALYPLRLPSCCSRFPVDRMTAPAVTHRRATPPRLPQGSAPPSNIRALGLKRLLRYRAETRKLPPINSPRYSSRLSIGLSGWSAADFHRRGWRDPGYLSSPDSTAIADVSGVQLRRRRPSRFSSPRCDQGHVAVGGRSVSRRLLLLRKRGVRAALGARDTH